MTGLGRLKAELEEGNCMYDADWSEEYLAAEGELSDEEYLEGGENEDGLGTAGDEM